MNNTVETSKTIFRVFDDITEAEINLSLIPTMLQNVVENFKLDERDLTELEVWDIGRRRSMINDTITLTCRTIWELEERIEELYEKYKKLENTATTTETTK